MRILVTGGAGFIGRWVVKRFLFAGHRVGVIDDLSSGNRQNLAECEASPNFEGLTVAGVGDRAALSRFFGTPAAPELCLHLAGQVNVQSSLDDPGRDFATNVAGAHEILEQCRRHHVRLVMVSTCMVYAPAVEGKAIDETHPVEPRSPYAAAKLAAEELALGYCRAYGLPVTVLRPFNTYGPFQRADAEGGVVAIFTDRALRGLPLNVYGNGSQTRDLMYVGDCVEFICRASLAEQAVGQILNAGTGQDTAIIDLASKVRDSVVESGARKVPIRHVPPLHPRSEIGRLVCDYGKVHRLLGWRPVVGLEEGIRRTVAWTRSRQGATAVTPSVEAGRTP